VYFSVVKNFSSFTKMSVSVILFFYFGEPIIYAFCFNLSIQ
jgi:hypothetical protein